MKKIILSIITVFIGVMLANAQITEYGFEYKWTDTPACNPFATTNNFYDAWKVSHGSPSCVDVYGQGRYNIAKLVAKYPFADAIEKSEGLYIPYTFDSHHGYTISIGAAQGDGDEVGIGIYAANGITENSDKDCGEAKVPTASITTDEIFGTYYVNDNLPGNFNAYTISEYVPNSSYGQLWIKSSQAVLDKVGSLLVLYIAIEDLGGDSQAPTAPGNLTASAITKSSITISWTASTDNLEVGGYKVYKNGALVKDVTGTSYTFTGLSSCTSYTFSVKAYDTRNNFSSASVITKSTGADFPARIVLASNLTEEVKHIAQATEYVLLNPGFEFDAVDGNYLFEALVSNECRTLSSTSANELTQLSSEEEITITTKSATSEITNNTYKFNQDFQDDNKMKFYPNPTSGFLNIDFYNTNTTGSVKVIDNSGKILVQYEINSESLSIDLSSLSPGIYHVMVTTLDNNIIKKIIKQ
jgi:hypothetical protein